MLSSEKIIYTLATITAFLLVSTMSLVAWIAVKVWDMNPTVQNTARRVDRIVEVLPDVKTRLALEDIERKFGIALLTTEPVEVANGKWRASVHYLDFNKGSRKIYVQSVKGPDDHLTAITVAGLAARTAREKLSLQEFMAASLEVEKPTMVPTVLDSSASYAILRSTANYEQRLKLLLGEPVRQESMQRGQVKWEQLAKQLREQESSLRPN